MLKVERPHSKEWVDGIVAFLSTHLPTTHDVHAGYLAPMLAAGMMHIFVDRAAEGGKINGVELWLTMPNPVKGGERILKHICSAGVMPAETTEYRSVVFTTFDEGYSYD